MQKLITLEKAAKYSKNQQKAGYTVGLITGCFDIVHMGHINLFRFAKNYADKIIVGLDNDSIVKLTKGRDRPINNYKRRSQFLSEFEVIDKVFLIKGKFIHGDKKAEKVHENIISVIKPSYLFSSYACDIYFKEKIRIAKKFNVKFLLDKSKKVTNTSAILKLIEAEL